MPPRSPKSPLPFSTLLSFALVSFTIEFDNHAEHLLPHYTTNYGRHPHSRTTKETWLVSLPMYLNCLQFLDAAHSITIRELFLRARTRTNLPGMHRWGYIKITPPPATPKNKKPDATWLVTTPAGVQAQQIWRDTLPAIENKWRDRFSPSLIDRLCDDLIAIATQLDPALPDCLPILQYGLLNCVSPRRAQEPCTPLNSLPLPSLLSRILLAFALDFESHSPLSLAIAANPLRVLSATPTPLRELPLLTGVSKESLAMALKFLLKKNHVVIAADKSAKRGQAARLTPSGLAAQRAASKTLADTEQDWRARFGPVLIDQLRDTLSQLAANRQLLHSLTPHPHNWRAKLPPPLTLPHFPMTLHRGAFPDGS